MLAKPGIRTEYLFFLLDSSGSLLQGMGYLVSHDICEFAAHATQHLLDTAPEVSTVNPA